MGNFIDGELMRHAILRFTGLGKCFQHKTLFVPLYWRICCEVSHVLLSRDFYKCRAAKWLVFLQLFFGELVEMLRIIPSRNLSKCTWLLLVHTFAISNQLDINFSIGSKQYTPHSTPFNLLRRWLLMHSRWRVTLQKFLQPRTQTDCVSV